MSGARRLVTLDASAVERLRRARAMGIPQSRLAKRFGVSTQTIRRVLRHPAQPSGRPKGEDQAEAR